MIHFEPMLTRDWLQTKPDHSEAIAVPAAYTKTAYYPTRYSVRYDAARKEYTIALDGMVWREAAGAKPSVAAKTPPVAPKTLTASKTARK
jgi:hypothetical protein